MSIIIDKSNSPSFGRHLVHAFSDRAVQLKDTVNGAADRVKDFVEEKLDNLRQQPSDQPTSESPSLGQKIVTAVESNALQLKDTINEATDRVKEFVEEKLINPPKPIVHRSFDTLSPKEMEEFDLLAKITALINSSNPITRDEYQHICNRIVALKLQVGDPLHYQFQRFKKIVEPRILTPKPIVLEERFFIGTPINPVREAVRVPIIDKPPVLAPVSVPRAQQEEFEIEELHATESHSANNSFVSIIVNGFLAFIDWLISIWDSLQKKSS